ncbi:hypothetical protein OTU49_009930, partial [Cherax quadricarinatus]
SMLVLVISVVTLATSTVLAAPQQGYASFLPASPDFTAFLEAQESRLQKQLIPAPARHDESAVGTGNEHHHHDDHGHHGHHDHQTGLQWLRDSVPGEPGQDYPIYWRVPETSFSCEGRLPGYYADTETRCQAFHICNVVEIKSFLCPNGSIFNQQHFTCEWWSSVQCETSPDFYSLNNHIGIVGQESKSWITINGQDFDSRLDAQRAQDVLQQVQQSQQVAHEVPLFPVLQPIAVGSTQKVIDFEFTKPDPREQTSEDHQQVGDVSLQPVQQDTDSVSVGDGSLQEDSGFIAEDVQQVPQDFGLVADVTDVVQPGEDFLPDVTEVVQQGYDLTPPVTEVQQFQQNGDFGSEAKGNGYQVQEDLVPDVPEVVQQVQEDLAPDVPEVVQQVQEDLVPDVPEVVQQVQEDLVPDVPEVVQQVQEDLVPDVTGVVQQVQEDLVPEVTEVVQQVQEDLVPDVPEVVQQVQEDLVPEVTEVVQQVQEDLAPDVPEVVQQVQEDLVPDVPEVVQQVQEDLVPEVTEVVQQVQEDLVPDVTGVVQQVQEDLVPDVPEVVQQVQEDLVPEVTEVVQQVQEDLVPDVPEVVQQVQEDLVPDVTGVVQQVQEDLVPDVTGVVQQVQEDFVPEITEAVHHVQEYLVPEVKDVPQVQQDLDLIQTEVTEGQEVQQDFSHVPEDTERTPETQEVTEIRDDVHQVVDLVPEEEPAVSEVTEDVDHVPEEEPAVSEVTEVVDHVPEEQPAVSEVTEVVDHAHEEQPASEVTEIGQEDQDLAPEVKEVAEEVQYGYEYPPKETGIVLEGQRETDVTSGVVTGVQDIGEGLDSVSEGLDGVSEGLDGVSEGLDGVSEGLDGVSEVLDGVSEGLDGVSEVLNGVSEGLDGASEVLDGVSGLDGVDIRQPQEESNLVPGKEVQPEVPTVPEQVFTQPEQVLPQTGYIIDAPEQVFPQPEQVFHQTEDITSAPEQAFSQPEQVFHQTEDITSAPEQVFPQPEQVFHQTEDITSAPEQVFHETEDITSAPEQVFSQPEQVFHQTEDITSAPEQVFPQPEQVFHQTEDITGAPEQVFPQPEQVFSQTEDIDGAPEQVFPQPEQVFPQPEQMFPQPEQVFSQTEDITSTPEQVFPQPEQVFSQTEDIAGAPEQVFPQPEQVFSQTEDIVGAPEQVFPQPEQVFPQPEQVFPQPEDIGSSQGSQLSLVEPEVETDVISLLPGATDESDLSEVSPVAEVTTECEGHTVDCTPRQVNEITQLYEVPVKGTGASDIEADIRQGSPSGIESGLGEEFIVPGVSQLTPGESFPQEEEHVSLPSELPTEDQLSTDSESETATDDFKEPIQVLPLDAVKTAEDTYEPIQFPVQDQHSLVSPSGESPELSQVSDDVPASVPVESGLEQETRVESGDSTVTGEVVSVGPLLSAFPATHSADFAPQNVTALGQQEIQEGQSVPLEVSEQTFQGQHEELHKFDLTEEITTSPDISDTEQFTDSLIQCSQFVCVSPQQDSEVQHELSTEPILPTGVAETVKEQDFPLDPSLLHEAQDIALGDTEVTEVGSEPVTDVPHPREEPEESDRFDKPQEHTYDTEAPQTLVPSDKTDSLGDSLSLFFQVATDVPEVISETVQPQVLETASETSDDQHPPTLTVTPTAQDSENEIADGFAPESHVVAEQEPTPGSLDHLSVGVDQHEAEAAVEHHVPAAQTIEHQDTIIIFPTQETATLPETQEPVTLIPVTQHDHQDESPTLISDDQAVSATLPSASQDENITFISAPLEDKSHPGDDESAPSQNGAQAAVFPTGPDTDTSFSVFIREGTASELAAGVPTSLFPTELGTKEDTVSLDVSQVVQESQPLQEEVEAVEQPQVRSPPRIPSSYLPPHK